MSKAGEVIEKVQERKGSSKVVVQAIVNGIMKWKGISDYTVAGDKLYLELKDGQKFVVTVKGR